MTNGVVATRQQIPLRLPYAMTIHKCQGKYLFKIVCFSVVITIFMCTTYSLYASYHVCLSCLSVCLFICVSQFLCLYLSPLYITPPLPDLSHLSLSLLPTFLPSPSLPLPPTLPSFLYLSLFFLSVMSLYFRHIICGSVLFRINTTESCRAR